MTKNTEKINFKKVNFPEICKNIRKTTGFTQQQMADFLGVCLRVYQRYEAGDARPHADVAFRIAEMHVCFGLTFMSGFTLKTKHP